MNMAKNVIEKHMIQKQYIEVSFEDISDAFALQNHVSEVFHEKILPQMELLFDEFADEQHLITFDELRIDCPELSREHWEQEWVEETIRGLRRELLAASKIRILQDDSMRTIQDEFFFFLKHGFLPWNHHITSIQEFEELVSDSRFVERLQEFIRTGEEAPERLVYNFSEKFITIVINSMARSQQIVVENLINLIAREPRHVRSILQARMLKTICSEEPPDLPLLLEEIRKSPTEFISRKSMTKSAQVSPGKRKDESEAIYVDNAGLVILHPYLQQLFEAFDLIRNKSWTDKWAQYAAVRVLQYLVTGNDESPEFDLPLNKVVCGLMPEDVLEVREPLSEEIRGECDSLVEAVIEHWAALKNTGVAAFRETFLQRNGKMTQVNNGWLLQVEQKAVDVLLSRLPWGIGTIRLPWMDQIIHTEWC
jgi:hypothetical protein